MGYFKNFVFIFEKKKHINQAAYISLFRMQPLKLLEKSVSSGECEQKRNQDFAKREELKPKVVCLFFFAQSCLI